MKKTIFFTLALLLLPRFYAVGSDLTDELKDHHERQILKTMLLKRIERTFEGHQDLERSFEAAKQHQKQIRALLDFQSGFRLNRIKSYRTMLSQTSDTEIIPVTKIFSAMREKEDAEIEEMHQTISQKILSSLEKEWEAAIENHKKHRALFEQEFMEIIENLEKLRENQFANQLKEIKKTYEFPPEKTLEEVLKELAKIRGRMFLEEKRTT